LVWSWSPLGFEPDRLCAAGTRRGDLGGRGGGIVCWEESCKGFGRGGRFGGGLRSNTCWCRSVNRCKYNQSLQWWWWILVLQQVITTMHMSLTFIGSCIVIYFHSKTNQMHNVSGLFIFGLTLYMFQTVFPSIIRSSRLYIHHQVYVQSWTPDDGRKDRPKHVEC